MITQKTYMAQQEYYNDQRRAAAAYRRARSVRGEGNRFYAQALGWLGNRLVAWGSRLQQEYNTVVSSTMPQTAKPAVGQ
jgi:hypothetical protein